MKHEKLSQALSYLSDRHIAQAVKSRNKYRFLAAVAALLVIVIALGVVLRPYAPFDATLQDPTQPTVVTDPPFAGLTPVTPLSHRHAVSLAQLPKLCSYPTDGSTNSDQYKQWQEDQRALRDQPLGYADSLLQAWTALIPQLLTQETGTNAVCSPLNIYMALAMLAEITDTQSRQQLLTLLNADSMEALRSQANQVWRAHYNNDGVRKSILGSSLWLDDAYSFNADTTKLLSDNYYASVFRGDLGSDEMNHALRSWLNEQTDNLLHEQTDGIYLSPETVLSLATTICYQVPWNTPFHSAQNTQAVFHGAQGDTTETFMNTELSTGIYVWGEHFTGGSLPLADGSVMWLFLPDADRAPEDIVADAMNVLSQPYSRYPNHSITRLRLSLPKFDVTGTPDVKDALKALGVQAVFDSAKADFTPIAEQTSIYVSDINHAARVRIDEEGLLGAAFTVVNGYGTSMPADIAELMLDRPFFFCVQSRDGLPLFTGIVNTP